VYTALLPILTFGAVVAAIGGIYSILSDLYLRDRSRVNQRIDAEFRQMQRERARKAMLFKDLSKSSSEVVGAQESPLSLRNRFLAVVEQSGLDITPRRLLLITSAVGLGAGLLGGLVRQSLVVGAVGTSVGCAVPLIYVWIKRMQRMEKLLSQLPDAFDLMSRVIRAGQTMSQGLLAVADEFAPPIATEFSYCYEQQNLGLSPELAMRDLARRTGLVEIKIFVTGMLVQLQSGGNLAEMLEKLSATIRQRYRLQGQIKTLTAEGRFQAIILLALPIVMFLIFLVLNPAYEGELLKHPTLIVATLVCEGIGGLWIHKIVNIDI
jgi:tight adherence protein B